MVLKRPAILGVWFISGIKNVVTKFLKNTEQGLSLYQNILSDAMSAAILCSPTYRSGEFIFIIKDGKELQKICN